MWTKTTHSVPWKIGQHQCKDLIETLHAICENDTWCWFRDDIRQVSIRSIPSATDRDEIYIFSLKIISVWFYVLSKRVWIRLQATQVTHNHLIYCDFFQGPFFRISDLFSSFLYILFPFKDISFIAEGVCEVPLLFCSLVHCIYWPSPRIVSSFSSLVYNVCYTFQPSITGVNIWTLPSFDHRHYLPCLQRETVDIKLWYITLCFGYVIIRLR